VNMVRLALILTVTFSLLSRLIPFLAFPSFSLITYSHLASSIIEQCSHFLLLFSPGCPTFSWFRSKLFSLFSSLLSYLIVLILLLSISRLPYVSVVAVSSSFREVFRCIEIEKVEILRESQTSPLSPSSVVSHLRLKQQSCYHLKTRTTLA